MRVRTWLILATVLALAVITTNALAQPTLKLEDVIGEHIYVPVGSVVTVYVKVHASGGPVKGWLTAVVKKDIIGEADKEYVTLKKYIEIPEGQTKTIKMGTFVAIDKTTDAWWAVGSVREYFVEVYFGDHRIDPYEGYNPSNPDVRPWVKTY